MVPQTEIDRIIGGIHERSLNENIKCQCYENTSMLGMG